MSEKSKPVYVFDLDGVITDPENSRVDDAIVSKIYDLLIGGHYVAVNTGRSYDWVEENFIHLLKAHNNDAILSQFIAICEKGGESITWNNGHVTMQPSEFALPANCYDIAFDVFAQNKARLTTMFWDETKRTMATIEKLPVANLAVFHLEQAELLEMLRIALQEYTVRILPTTIATDIELSTAGKYVGAKLIYTWINETVQTGEYAFVSIGDSASDYETARYFAEQQAGSTFVYVGNVAEEIRYDERVELIIPENMYCAGTLEFLNKNTEFN